MKRKELSRAAQRPCQLDFLGSLTAEKPGTRFDDHPSEDGLFLPGLPTHLIREIYANAPGNEIGSGKFSHPESSAVLAANTFGLFLRCPGDMPPIPGFESGWSPAKSVSLEVTLRFPWDKGRHPCLDAIVVTETIVFAIEAKRFEPYREKPPAFFSSAYWRCVWGDQMDGYEFIRDMLRGSGTLFSRLDAAQLVKHALGLRTAIHRTPHLRGKLPVLIYLYAEPEFWPDGRKVHTIDFKAHRREIRRFENCVFGAEVTFKSIPYRKLLQTWQSCNDEDVQRHASSVMRRYQI
jgi:hypothetical protein